MKFILFTLICGSALGVPRISFAANQGDEKSVEACLENWGTHPFGKGKHHFRVISAKVKVLGIGGNIRDELTTEKPELVLIKPNVSVLSKTELHLMNPNGWYCLKGKVAVLGKTVIKLNCKASIASTSDGAVVLGGSDKDDGVTVLGSSRLDRVGCNK